MGSLLARRATATALWSLCTIVGCAPYDDDGDRLGDVSPLGTAKSAYVGGTASGPSDNFAVHITRGDSNAPAQCTGVLVSPTLILTAKHCVMLDTMSESEVQCQLGTNAAPATAFHVRVGATSQEMRAPLTVRSVFADRDSEECTKDIAGLELAEPVQGISFPALVLDIPPAVGDPVVGVGWGDIGYNRSNEGIRQRGEGVIVGLDGRSYPTQGGSRTVADGYIVASTGACQGDSGGPLLDKNGAALGVVFGAVLADLTYKNCEGALSLYVPFYRHVDFVERFFRSVGKMPPRAGRPVPAELAGECSENNECNSNFCVKVGSAGTCSKTCSLDADCGQSLSCTDTGAGSSVCLDLSPAPSAASACTSAVGPKDGASSGVIALGLATVAAAMVVARRRRSSRRADAPLG